MEPLRPFVDLRLAEFIAEQSLKSDKLMKRWCRAIANGLARQLTNNRNQSIQLLDAIDLVASALASALAQRDADAFWAPTLQ